MDQTQIIYAIKENYPWKSINNLNVLRDGPDNTVFSMNVDDIKVIVRLSKRELNINDYRFESELISHLYINKIPVARIYKNIRQDYFTNILGQIITIFEYVSGESANSVNDLPLDTVKSAGITLAKIHNITSKYIPTHTKTRTIFTEFEKILSLSQEFIKNVYNGAEIISRLTESYNWAKSQKNSDQIIHNDYRVGNLLYLQNQVCAVLDFDWSCLGSAKKDLGLALVEWSYPDGSTMNHNQTIFETFLTGYNSVAEIKVLNDKNLNLWMSFSAFSDACTYYFDAIQEVGGLTKAITLNSYMYKKGEYFANLI